MRAGSTGLQIQLAADMIASASTAADPAREFIAAQICGGVILRFTFPFAQTSTQAHTLSHSHTVICAQ